MVKYIVRIISALVIVLSGIWLYVEGGFEPLITMLAGIAGLLSSIFIRSETTQKKVEQSSIPGSDISIEPEMFESEFWPEEGRPVFITTTTHLKLFARPSLDAPMANEIEVAKNSEIKFNAFRYRTIRPGEVIAKADGVLKGRNLGKMKYLSRETYYESYSEYLEFPYAKGTSFEYLQYRAEGSCFIRWAGNVIDLDLCPWLDFIYGKGLDKKALVLTREPIAESWLQVINSNGKPIGWLLADGVTKVVDRTF